MRLGSGVLRTNAKRTGEQEITNVSAGSLACVFACLSACVRECVHACVFVCVYFARD